MYHNKNITFFIVLMFIYLASGIYLAFAQTKEIIDPIKQATEITGKMCQGDFSKRLNFDRNDEIGQLSKNLNRLAENIKGSASPKKGFIKPVRRKRCSNA